MMQASEMCKARCWQAIPGVDFLYLSKAVTPRSWLCRVDSGGFRIFLLMYPAEV